MFKPRKRREEDKPIEANLIPVLSCMFLMIPALLLAMEVARMVSIPVSTPKWSSLPGGDPTPDDTIRPAVHIRADGFSASTSADPSVDIPMRNGSYDFAQLQQWAQRLKALHPTEWTVTISAERDVQMQVLVEAMDSLRGDACRLQGAAAGEDVPPDCLLWRPIVSESPLG
jgi:biopolymer transport protein ExbD